MNYKRKRIKAGISAYTMSKELGVDYEKYLKVEKKLIPLEGELINKFQNVLKNAKIIKFNHKQKMHEINQFIAEGKMKELMAKRGYNGLALANAIGIAPSEISHVLNGKNQNEERVELVYDFLMNPINLNVEAVGEKPVETKVDEEEVNFDATKIKKMMKKKKINLQKLASGIGMGYSTVCKCFQEQFKNHFGDTKEKITNFVMEYSESQNEKTFVDKIETIIKENNLFKQDIEKELGISKGYLSKILNGTSKASKELTERIAEYFSKYEKTPQIEENAENTPIILEDIKTTEIEAENVEKSDDKDIASQLDDYIVKEIEDRKFEFELLKENHELKEELAKTKRQVALYEKLIERL